MRAGWKSPRNPAPSQSSIAVWRRAGGRNRGGGGRPNSRSTVNQLPAIACGSAVDRPILAQLKEKFPHLTVSIAVGGWTLSTHFSTVCSTAAGRETFANSLVKFLD
ncbi:MAG: glycosyl hydrolase family 18 protein, partial [Planctomycetota bacterium]